MKLMRVFLFALVALSTLIPLASAARAPVPIESFEGLVAADSSSSSPTQEEVRKAIYKAAADKDWVLKETSPGVLLATLNVRDKHRVVTEIRYSAEKYSLVYVQSVNMNEAIDKDGKAVIHPFYNKWVRTLRDQIRLALARA
ncbi:MAG: hypothetical protein JWP29_4406 [Rhodoferax sp.]|nr:hypothetical protein [Rhodoferax sp.]